MICKSRTYQLSIEGNRWNEDDEINFSHGKARRLPAEVLFDSVYAVTGATPEIPGAKPGVRATQLVDAATDLKSGFLANLGRPARESAAGLMAGLTAGLTTGSWQAWPWARRHCRTR